MLGGIGENGAFFIDRHGNRVQGTLTEITVTDGESTVKVYNSKGLGIPRDQQTDLPNFNSLLGIAALFRGRTVVIDHGQEGNKASPFGRLLNRLIPWKRGKE